MYHRKILNLGTPLILCFLVLGCSTPKHTDLLVFGTNTQMGVSVDTDATASPGLNIGFKRQELVLMPLYVNAQESKLPPSGTTISPEILDKAKYQGQETGKADTYSVLASFGAKGAAETSGTGTVAIAQFFATGIAARTLANFGGALVNTSDEAATSATTVGPKVAAANAEMFAVHQSTLDAIMAKLATDDGSIDLEKLKKAFTGIQDAPNDTTLASWAASGKGTVRNQIGTLYQFDLKDILANLNNP